VAPTALTAALVPSWTTWDTTDPTEDAEAEAAEPTDDADAEATDPIDDTEAEATDALDSISRSIEGTALPIALVASATTEEAEAEAALAYSATPSGEGVPPAAEIIDRVAS
jgi:hypothetical protein